MHVCKRTTLILPFNMPTSVLDNQVYFTLLSKVYDEGFEVPCQ
jgi:hypothetical protein